MKIRVQTGSVIATGARGYFLIFSELSEEDRAAFIRAGNSKEEILVLGADEEVAAGLAAELSMAIREAAIRRGFETADGKPN